MVMSAAAAHAGVAEASTGTDRNHPTVYDFSGLSDHERKWFATFLEGNFFADGWREITADIVGYLPAEDQESSRELLNELGNRIGREWCRNNDQRRIDTSMLKKWGRRLKSTARQDPQEIAELIQYIKGEVNSLLN
jgi:hypothetical protein